MKEYKDKEILEGIINNDNNILKYVYVKFFPLVEKMVLQNGGDTGNAKDVFQDALMSIYRHICEEELVLTCKLSTYIYAICRNLWIQFKKSGKLYIHSNVDELELVHDAEPSNHYELKMLEIYDRHFKKISKNCQKILQMHVKGRKIADIKKAMNHSNVHHTMDRKYRCKASLIKRIINDPEFKEIRDEIKKESNPLYGRNVG